MRFRIFTIVLLAMMMCVAFGVVPSLPAQVAMEPSREIEQLPQIEEVPEDIMPWIENAIAQDDDTPSATYPADYDFGQVLGDRVNEYKTVYEPWRSKAAIHAIAYHRPTGFLALGGGYLYDNEIHIFRLNTQTKLWDKVWDSGDSIIQGDVMSLDFGDTDLNKFLEIVAGSSDGNVYVFEQTHIYDPHANTENRFELVWTSPDMFKVFAVKVDDVDRDYRPDIIVGAWDGYVHLFEYFNHSYYPFEEEHWIDYWEVSKLYVGEKVYSLETTDTNLNGLPEIIVGTREGTVFVFENDGITMMINGYPFPLIHDNHYYLNWTSENYTWTPIQSMSVGELDGSPGKEIAIVAQGQGILVLDWNPTRKTYDYQKVYRDFEPWETFGFWGLDEWVDRVTVANNVTYRVNASLTVPEPIQYVWAGDHFEPDASVYPYNTGMATYSDANYSIFDSSPNNIHNATAVVDFGLDEEGTGGASAAADVIVKFRYALDGGVKTDFNISVSQDGLEFEQINPNRTWIYLASNNLYVDVDDALSRRRWDWFRYMKLSVFNNATYELNSLKLINVYNTLVDTLSVTIGPLRLYGESYLEGTTEPLKIIAGSVTGEFTAVMWNNAENEYDVIWDSGDDAWYAFGENIWDIEYVGNQPNIPTWSEEFQSTLNPYGGTTFNSWSVGCLNPGAGPEADFNILMGTNEAGIRAFFPLGVQDTDTTAYFSNINSALAVEDWVNVSVEAPWFATTGGAPYSIYPMVALGVLNPNTAIEDIPIEDSSKFKPKRATIWFYYRDSELSAFNHRLDLWDIDTTQELAQVINFARTTPRMDFQDIDGDDDLDMVVSNGYVYMARNMWKEEGVLNFTLVHGYFDDVNNLPTSKVWGQPDLADLDNDGDVDLVLSYANKNGGTFFRNMGTNDNPIWVEDKKVFSNPTLTGNMKYLNLTGIRIIPNTGPYETESLGWFYEVLGWEIGLELWYNALGWEMPADYCMGSFNTYSNLLYWCAPRYDTTESYMIASYPRVAQIDFSLMEPAASGWKKYNNLGFHVHESWDNSDDLEDWTLTIASGDIDGDGKGEMIVGDYDNNVYVFEHLRNHTYKRMHRTFDLNHTEKSDVSPYYYEELEGISGEFYRKIWDHAEHLVVDVDLDQDGLKEMIVATGLQIYIFEDKGLTGGDELAFVYSIDLRDNDFSIAYFHPSQIGPGSKYYDPKGTSFKPWDFVDGITAMAAGDDIDYDGQRELAVGAGPFLFCFNVPEGGFEGTEENDFFVTSPGLAGRYFLVGNPALLASSFVYTEINAMTMCDTDKDGYRELIIGGTNATNLQRPHGFVHIYECQGGSFRQAWAAPTEVTYWNPVTVLKLDDQDYDGEQEIIIGHSNGFDMWEHIPGTDSMYQKVEYVTASPNYPIVPLRSTYVSGDPSPVLPHHLATEDGRRCRKDMARLIGDYSNQIWHVYESYDGIYLKKYNVSEDLWLPTQQLTWKYPVIDVDTEYNPSISVHADTGDVYLVWEGLDSTTSDHALFLAYYDVSEHGWENEITYLPDTILTKRYSPSVFDFNTTHMGIAYLYNYFFLFNQRYGALGCRIIEKEFSFSSVWTSMSVPFNDWAYIEGHDVSAVKLPDGTYAIAMSAVNKKITKADHDIWVVVGDSDFNFTNQYPHQATTSYYDEMFVDIDYLRSEDNSMIVIYESIGAPVEDRFGMVASHTKGATWSVQETLNVLPQYVKRIEYPGGWVWYERVENGWPIYGPTSYTPCVIGMDDAGFMYTCTFSYIMYWSGLDIGHLMIADLVYGINPQSDWALNHLRDVVDLDVGDTDNDGRREVVVGFENQVGVYELKHSTNTTGFMSYEEAWLSEPYMNPVTGVTVYDSSGNGWEEIGVSTERGEVYFLEYKDPSEGATNLIFSQQTWNISVPGWGNWGHRDSLLSYDIDDDGMEEIIAAGYEGNDQVIAINPNGTILWNYTGANLGSGFSDMLLEDLNNDSMPEIVCSGRDGILYVIDITTGQEVWNYTTGASLIMTVEAGDLDADGIPELVMGVIGNELTVVNSTGHLFDTMTMPTGEIFAIAIGNFTGENVTTIAIATSTDAVLRIVNWFNDTIIYESPIGTVNWISPLKAHDFNDDGIHDVVFTWDKLHILDPVTKTIYYNSSYYGLVASCMEIGDFDGDNIDEVFVMTNLAGVYLEEPKSGTTQWRYHPQTDFFWDSAIGYFGGTGEIDIALASMLGFVIVLDGKNGVPMWFNLTYGDMRSVTAADIHGEGIDSLISWSLTSSMIFAIDGLEPYTVEIPPEWVVHDIYWEQQFNDSSIVGTWVADVLGDGREEIVVADKSGNLFLLNATTGGVIWNRTVEGIVKEVRFGDLDGQGAPEMAALLNPHMVLLIDSTTGNNFTNIVAPDGTQMVSCLLGPFSDKEESPYDELCILYHEKDTNQVFARWYNKDGNKLWWVDTNRTSSSNELYLVAGNLTDSPTWDILYGGPTLPCQFFIGYDGTYRFSEGDNCYGIVIGNFLDDEYEEFAIMEGSGEIKQFDVILSGDWVSDYLSTIKIAPVKYIRNFYAADLYLNDGRDEVVVNAMLYGVLGFDASANEVWRFETPLVISKTQSSCDFGDADGDGHTDLIFSNWNYINVISGATERLIWHYRSDARCTYPKVGHFYSTSSPLDVVTYFGNTTYIVSGSEIPPTPPPIPVVLAAGTARSLVEVIVETTITVVPIGLVVIIPLAIVWKRKRKYE